MASGYEARLARLLAHDILDLANDYALVCVTARLAIRLEVVETDACRRFHADYVRSGCSAPIGARDAVDPHRFGKPRGADEVGIFKRRRLLDDPSVLHRSPPLGDYGEPRLLLVIDPVTAD